jgi:hypothetical protein
MYSFIELTRFMLEPATGNWTHYDILCSKRLKTSPAKVYYKHPFSPSSFHLQLVDVDHS